MFLVGFGLLELPIFHFTQLDSTLQKTNDYVSQTFREVPSATQYTVNLKFERGAISDS